MSNSKRTRWPRKLCLVHARENVRPRLRDCSACYYATYAEKLRADSKKERARQWVKKYKHESYLRNKEAWSEKYRAYYQKNRDKILARAKQRREDRLAYTRAWRKANPDKVRASLFRQNYGEFGPAAEALCDMTKELKKLRKSSAK